MHNNPDPSQTLLSQAEAARLLNIGNPRTLAAWRLRRCGPPYVQVGHLIRYDVDDLRAWLASRRVDHAAAQP